jgi:Glycosyl hydrolase family 12
MKLTWTYVLIVALFVALFTIALVDTLRLGSRPTADQAGGGPGTPVRPESPAQTVTAPGPTVTVTVTAPASQQPQQPQQSAGPGGGGGSSPISGYATVPRGSYQFQTDEYNSRAPLTLTPQGSGFAVTSTGISIGLGGAPGAYPSEYKGCQWGKCSPGSSGLPIQLTSSSLSQVKLTDHTRTVPGGVWDDAFDIFFTPCSTCQQNGAGGSKEMMIWLAYSVVKPGHLTGTATIDGISFSVYQSSHTVWYLAQGGNASVTDMALAPFVTDALHRGAIPSSSWYLMDIEAGFELWSGGQGLAITSLSICTPAGC